MVEKILIFIWILLGLTLLTNAVLDCIRGSLALKMEKELAEQSKLLEKEVAELKASVSKEIEKLIKEEKKKLKGGDKKDGSK